jgi:SAM-dependent methyltransferase
MAPDHDAAEYGRHIAEDYDAIYGGIFDTDGAVDRLLELGDGGPLLELGVGTGRLAIPLAAAGLTVHGVDGSADMLAHLASKPGGDRVDTTLGDFAEVTVEGRFSLVALIAHTIYALPDQAAQVRCFANAARHLAPGGRFVVEAWIPKLAPHSRPTVEPRTLSGGHIGLVVAEHDAANQLLRTTQIVLGGSVGVRVFPVVHRYAHPAELDLMAQLAGMHLEHRWADWHQRPVTADSEHHVSVYRLSP